MAPKFGESDLSAAFLGVADNNAAGGAGAEDADNAKQEDEEDEEEEDDDTLYCLCKQKDDGR